MHIVTEYGKQRAFLLARRSLETSPNHCTASYGERGHEHLNQFGLINMNARLYDPVLGRFLAPDPLVANPGTNGFNRYAYASNNPLMYVDISGEACVYPDESEGREFWNELKSSPNIPYYIPPFTQNLIFRPTDAGFNPSTVSNSSGGYNSGNYGGYSSISNAGYNSGDWNNYGGYDSFKAYYGRNKILDLITTMQYLLGPKSKPADFLPHYTGTPTPYPGTAAAKPAPTLSKPVGTGSSSVYAGGGRSVRGNANTGIIGAWIKNHIFMESEFRIDKGNQIALIGQVAGIRVGFDLQKDTSPIKQANISYNEGWDICAYPDFGYPSDFIRTSLAGGIGIFGASGNFESTPYFFSLGEWKSENINIGPVTVAKEYNSNGSIKNTQYSLDFGLNLSIKYGLHLKFRFGYQY